MLGKLNIEYKELLKRHNRRLLLNKSVHPDFSSISRNEAEKEVSLLNSDKSTSEPEDNFNKLLSSNDKEFGGSNIKKENIKNDSPFFTIFRIAASLLFIILAAYSVYFIAFEFEFFKTQIAEKGKPIISDSSDFATKPTPPANDSIILEKKLSIPENVYKMPETFGFSSGKIDTTSVDINFLNIYLNREYPELEFNVNQNVIESSIIRSDNIEYYYRIIENNSEYIMSIISNFNTDSLHLRNILFNFKIDIDSIQE
jgi:hypothetical protein